MLIWVVSTVRSVIETSEAVSRVVASEWNAASPAIDISVRQIIGDRVTETLPENQTVTLELVGSMTQ